MAGLNANGSPVGLPIPNDIVNVALDFHDGYRAADFYVGARYYWGRYWCDRIAFFLGGQFGLVHRQDVDFDLPLHLLYVLQVPH